MFAGIDFAACERASVFWGFLPLVVAPGTHFFAALAVGMSVFINGNILGCAVAGLVPRVNVDERINPPSVQEFVCSDVVMGGIQAHVGERDTRHMTTEFVDRMEKTYTVVPFCAKELHNEWDFRL